MALAATYGPGIPVRRAPARPPPQGGYPLKPRAGATSVTQLRTTVTGVPLPV